MRYALLLVLLVGCSPHRKYVVGEVFRSPELNPAFAKVEPWLGDWHRADGDTRWVAANGAMYGVWFTKDTFTIHIVDDGDGAKPPDGVLRFIAIDNGRSYTELKSLGENEFRAFSHIDGAAPSTRASASALELEAADRAFAADVKARGADGWLAAFDPHGGMLRKGTHIEGDAIKDQMAGLLSEGVLAWDPIASGIDSAPGSSGELGFTVGKATYTPAKAGDESWASTYMTIWHHQPDGSWKVRFDTGRVVNR